MAKKKRESGEYAPLKRNHRRDTGELAAHDFFNNRDQMGHQGEPALLLMDDRPGLDNVRLHNLVVHLLSLSKHILTSAADVWASIGRNLPT